MERFDFGFYGSKKLNIEKLNCKKVLLFGRKLSFKASLHQSENEFYIKLLKASCQNKGQKSEIGLSSDFRAQQLYFSIMLMI